MKEFIVRHDVRIDQLESALNNAPEGYESWSVNDGNGTRKEYCSVIYRATHEPVTIAVAEPAIDEFDKSTPAPPAKKSSAKSKK